MAILRWGDESMSSDQTEEASVAPDGPAALRALRAMNLWFAVFLTVLGIVIAMYCFTFWAFARLRLLVSIYNWGMVPADELLLYSFFEEWGWLFDYSPPVVGGIAFLVVMSQARAIAEAMGGRGFQYSFGWTVLALFIMRGHEAPAISALLQKYESKYPQSVLFLYLLMLTGARPDEIARATWTMIDGNQLVLHEHKTDDTGEPRVIFLPERVVELLKLARRVADTDTITGIKSPRALWRKIRTEAGCPDLRMYDLRRTFASAALRAGYTLDQIGELLGHTSGTTSKRYAWMMEEIREEAAGKTAKVIEGMMEPKALIAVSNSKP